MKTIELFCASPASTSICSSSMEQYTMLRHGTKQIHRQTHRLSDHLKTKTPPCLSELPFNPRPSFHQKSTKTSSSRQPQIRRKSSADISDLKKHSPTNNSSRYLLSEKPLLKEKMKVVNNCKELEVFRSSSARSSNDESPVYKLPSITLGRLSHESLVMKNNNKTMLECSSFESPVYRLSSAKSNDVQVHKSYSTPQRNQVVELRVSIHCKGCEGKVRKHLSRMEGVKSFSIDLVSKKVTVEGNVTPQSVLASISKVKNAQFWPSPTSSSSSTTSSSSSSSSIMSRRA